MAVFCFSTLKEIVFFCFQKETAERFSVAVLSVRKPRHSDEVGKVEIN
jgi:hypothetical protein